jgi:hypothetical protein
VREIDVNNKRTMEGGSDRRAARTSLLIVGAAAFLLYNNAIALSGPCTAQIRELKRQIAGDVPGPDSGPTGTQTVGAQLHRQPTPGSVVHAERAANKDGDAAIKRAKEADSSGDAMGCNQALTEARRLYEIKN